MQSFLDPVILFFLFGVFAGSIKSNLEIPPQISRFLALYLLMALGLKGGFALAESGASGDIAASLFCAVTLAVVVPLLGYFVLKRVLSGFDAAAVAATYGSVSAVTFITATQFLETNEILYGGHMAAAMALMESPAIIIALTLASALRRQREVRICQGGPGGAAAIAGGPGHGFNLGKVLHESFTDGTQLLLLGALLIGYISGETGKAAMQPFSGDLFKGMLAFFLLDMGLLAARSLAGLKRVSPLLFIYAVVGPLTHAGLALGLAFLFGIAPGNGMLLMVLAASASYIAVPAVLRYAIPEANPPLYIGMPLALTFPFNIVIGIPLYAYLALAVLQ
ncbi:MAG TPA: sodium-dependent bicarbonate transport family permease [Noviherbaspirillum sp.]|nr:sodium-dependent bicarbonate transport family permease [Noviherbaspirillum sp.]